MNVSSQLDQVTVYASGALCIRLATAGAGARQVRVGGLPLSMKAGSLRARVGGESAIKVLDVRAGFDAQVGEAIDVSSEQQALEATQEKLSMLELKLARAKADIEALTALRPAFREPEEGAPPREAPVKALLALGRFTDEALKPRLEKRRALEQSVKETREELQLHQRRLAEGSTERRSAKVKLTRSAVITLSAETSAPLPLEIEYLVPGARWVPTYDLRLDKSLAQGTLAVRAFVAQTTGEDWRGVKLSLSTADLSRRTDLPELRSLRIGRAQPPPPRSGWREPPQGLDDLFAGYDEAMSGAPSPPMAEPMPPPAPPPPPMMPSPKMAAPMRPPSRSAPSAPGAMNLPAPSMQAMPVMAAKSRGGGVMAALGGAFASAGPARSRSMAPPREESVLAEMDAAPEGAWDEEATSGGGGERERTGEVAMPGTAGPDEAQLDYDVLAMPAPSPAAHGPRGRLRPVSEYESALISLTQVNVSVTQVSVLVHHAIGHASDVSELGLPEHAENVRTSAGFWDYRYDCDGRADVQSINRWTLIPVTRADVGLTPGYTCVPSVETKVYRVLSLFNRSPHALLQGPVDVSAGDEFLLSTKLPTLPPKGKEVQLGLGVEEAIKIARKSNFRETTGGLLGGSTVLPHEVEIEVANRLPHPATIEVRERIPVSSETEVKIEETQVKPIWDRDEQPRDGTVVHGGRRWKVALAPGEKTTLVAQYSIRIPADKMIVGGNRRV